MPVKNRFAEMLPEIAGWRQDFHRHPELMYDLPRTSARVAGLLRDFGVDEVVEGIGRTGVVAVIRGRGQGQQGTGAGRTLGLRADMDALPIIERTGLDHASQTPGVMHACGHDGHTAMLLGAAKYLAETRGFDGTVVCIFQPAEEGGAGAKAMIDDGLMERFGIDEVYGLHNAPGLPVGRFATRSGPLQASADEFTITVTGRGGHAAEPHRAVAMPVKNRLPSFCPRSPPGAAISTNTPNCCSRSTAPPPAWPSFAASFGCDEVVEGIGAPASSP
jgi:amidohydrolase